ncbi:hypothetical protein [Hymenobacter negativus]|uniref:Uncharacterized protein n=1 Tax=Hymenobacter negativus TaxID=2795026 RepID=A0ABS3QKY4_9BACT|nr:hypothetical protein [Hymenobacter negativus]MBO2011924.1 hypothetical protein [Hymenobacter negativus]
MLRHAFFLLLLAGPVSAQSVSPTSVSADSVRAAAPARFTSADTVRAIHRIYAKHRRIGNIMTIGAIGADLALAGISAAAEGAPKHSNGGYGWGGGGIHFGFEGFAVIYGVIAAPIMGVGIQQLIAFGPKHEAKMIARYEATGQLPNKIRCRLRKNLR